MTREIRLFGLIVGVLGVTFGVFGLLLAWETHNIVLGSLSAILLATSGWAWSLPLRN